MNNDERKIEVYRCTLQIAIDNFVAGNISAAELDTAFCNAENFAKRLDEVAELQSACDLLVQ